MSLPRVALLVVGCCALLWTPTLFINDEIAQAAALHSLAKGSLMVSSDLGPGYQSLQDQGSWHAWHPALPPEGQEAGPVGSTMLNVLALPILYTLQFLAAGFGHVMVLVAIAVLLVAAGLHSALGILRWEDRDRLKAAGAFALVFFLVSMALLDGDFPADLFLDAAALQLVSMVATGVAAAYFFDILRGFLPERNAFLVTLLGFLATPVFFWATNAKYHALSICLLVVCLWCIKQGRKTTPLRCGLAYAVAALAFWNQAPLGFILLLAVSWVLRPALLRNPVATAGLAILGAGTALVLWNWESLLLAAQGGGIRYVSPQTSVQGAMDLFANAFWNDPPGVVRSIVLNLLWVNPVPTLAAVCIAPFIVLAAGGWRRIPVSLAKFSLVYCALIFLLAGARLLDVGYSFDMRHTLTLWPLLLLLAAPALSDFLTRCQGRLFRALFLRALGWLSVVVVALAATHHWGGVSASGRVDFDLVQLNAYAGLALALTIGVASFLVYRGKALLRHRDALVADSLAVALGLQVLLKLHLGFRDGPSHAPFLIAWVDQAANLVGWAVFTIPGGGS